MGSVLLNSKVNGQSGKPLTSAAPGFYLQVFPKRSSILCPFEYKLIAVLDDDLCCGIHDTVFQQMPANGFARTFAGTYMKM